MPEEEVVFNEEMHRPLVYGAKNPTDRQVNIFYSDVKDFNPDNKYRVTITKMLPDIYEEEWTTYRSANSIYLYIKTKSGRFVYSNVIYDEKFANHIVDDHNKAVARTKRG